MPAQELILEPRQVPHFEELVEIGNKYRVAITTAPMGAGKTIVTIKVAQVHNLPILGFAPLSLTEFWWRESKKYGVNALNFMSYGKLRGTSRYGCTSGLITRQESENGPVYSATDEFIGLAKRGVLLIFDEMQAVKNDSAQSRAVQCLVSTLIRVDTEHKSRVIFCSASPCDRTTVTPLVRCLGLIHDPTLVKKVVGSRGYRPTGLFEAWTLARYWKPSLPALPSVLGSEEEAEDILYKWFIDIFRPALTSTMPAPAPEGTKRTIRCGFYDIVKERREDLLLGIKYLKEISVNRRTGFFSGKLTTGLRLIQKSCIPTLVRLAKKCLQEPNRKVVIFIHFIDEQLDELVNELGDYGVVTLHGSMNAKQRAHSVDRFQIPSADTRVLIGQIRVGGVGLSLDDTDGRYPRSVFIIPDYNFIPLLQACGRTYRAKTASDTDVNIVCPNYDAGYLKILYNLDAKTQTVKELVADPQQITELFAAENAYYEPISN